MNEVLEKWKDLGYTYVELCERNIFHMDDVDIERNSPLYRKIECIYGCQTENIRLIIFDGYGDNKDGNREALTYICDKDHLFFAGTIKECDRLVKSE